MAQDLISVIIPAYNESKTITACVNSLLNQSLKPQEIILIDDDSSDDTVSKIKRLQKKSRKIKLLIQFHKGPALARNKAAQIAKGKILVFVDADMEFEFYFLENLTEPIITKKAIGSWSGNEWVKNWDNLWARCWNYNLNRSDAHMISPDPGQRKVFRAILRSEFKKVGGYDATGYTDDWTLVEKLKTKPFITQAKFYHHNPSSLLKVFHQARWIGKRPYKLGFVGKLITILRANAGFSVIIGLTKSIGFKEPKFLIFKLVYDIGIILGILESFAGKRY
jgi:glycosyltransferase involved in cell wall biosynthesis